MRRYTSGRMFCSRRLKRIHAKFLESCRNLTEGRTYWVKGPGLGRWLLETLSPVPLMGLHEDGRRVLSALEWLEANCKGRALDEAAVLEYHRLLLGSEIPDAGQYRKVAISMVGDNPLRPPQAERVPRLMMQFAAKVTQSQQDFDAAKTLDPDTVLRSAVEVYYRIGVIHPFRDGNGRVARLAMNHLLRRYGMGYVIFPALTMESPVMKAFGEAQEGNLGPLVDCARGFIHPA